MTERTSVQHLLSAAVGLDGHVLVSGPPVSGRTTALTQAAVAWIADQGRPAHRIWWVPGSDHAGRQIRRMLAAHRTLATVHHVRLSTWLRRKKLLPEREGPGDFKRAAAAAAYLNRLELPDLILQALGLTAEGLADLPPVPPVYPTNPYSASYKSETQKLQLAYRQARQEYAARSAHIDAVLNGQPVTAVDSLLWAVGHLRENRGALQSALTCTTDLVVLDDFHAFTPLERAFLHRLLKGADVKVLANTDEDHAAETHAWLTRLERPVHGTALRERHVPLGHLLAARSLDPEQPLWPARGGAGTIGPGVHETLFAGLKAHIHTQRALSAQQGRSLAVLVTPELFARLNRATLGIEWWETSDHRPLTFMVALRTALRYRCGLSSPQGRHPLLSADWTLTDPNGKRIWLPERDSRAIQEAWSSGTPARATGTPQAELQRHQSQIDRCHTTPELAGAVRHLQRVEPTPDDERWMARTPDLFVALQELTARTHLPPPFLGVLGQTPGHWEDVIVILHSKRADATAATHGLLRATRSVRFFTYGDQPPAPDHPAALLERSATDRAETFDLLAQVDPPTADQMARITRDAIVTHYYETHWPAEVPDARRSAWAAAHGAPGTWAHLPPSRAWVTASSRFRPEEWTPGDPPPE